MAGSVLNRQEWVVYLPARGDGSARLSANSEFLAFAPGASQALRYTLDDMANHSKARSVCLLVDGRDALMLKLKVPALSGTKLRQALPNLVEDYLMADPAQACVAMGEKASAEHHWVGVVDRNWLEHGLAVFERRGFKVKRIWPTSQCLTVRPERIAVSAVNDGLVLRTNEHALGWHAGDQAMGRADALEALLESLGPGVLAQFSGVDAQCEDNSWKEALQVACSASGIACEVTGLQKPKASGVDFLPALGSRRSGFFGSKASSKSWDWSLWKWPIWLGIAALAVWLLGLNLDWARRWQERGELVVQRDRKFKQAMPNSRTEAEPVLQLKRQLANVRTQAGQTGAEDFSVLLARFSSALGARAIDALASLEYRENRLRIKFQPGMADSDTARRALQDACDKQGLRLQFDGERELSALVMVKP